MNATSLLAHLRAVGVSISSERGRLIVEAPPGVVTAELRLELVRCKAELVSALERSHDRTDEDSTVTEARREIVELLAVAYRRCAAIPKVGTDRPTNLVNGELANSSVSSVHGGVP